MTVAELIAALQKMPQDAVVYRRDDHEDSELGLALVTDITVDGLSVEID